MRKSSQGGFATIIVIVIGVVALAGIGYYLLSRTGAVPAVPGLASVTLNDKCKYNDKDLCKFLNNFKTFKDYTIAGTTTDKAGKKSAMVFKINGDTNFQTTLSSDGKENYNTIVIGDTTYTKDYSDNKWFKQKATKDDTAVKDDVTFHDNVDAAPAPADPTYTKIGTEACGKLTCFKYKVTMPGSTGTEFVLFDNKDYVLRQTETRDTDGSVTIATYNYDKITLSAPSPVKDTPAPATYTIPADFVVPSVDMSAAAASDTSTDTSTDTSAPTE